jgi:cell shape-determining protein MreC
MENFQEIKEEEVMIRTKGRPNTTHTVLIITVAVALFLLIFAVYKVFSNYPFTLPSYVAFYILILATFVFFFPLTRTYLEYLTLKFLADQKQIKPYVKQFLQDTDSSEDSIIAVKGEVRLIIALTIILILGIALFQLMATTGADDFVKSILAVFTGAITSIIGFYYGSKASKEGGAKSKDTSKAQGNEQHIIEALGTLSGLLDKKHITQEEYDAVKKELLDACKGRTS